MIHTANPFDDTLLFVTPFLQARLQTAKTASERLEQRARAILDRAPQIAGNDSKSLLAVFKPPLAAAYDAAAFKAARCDWQWETLKMAGFNQEQAKAAGCAIATAKP
jgi:hypothetical protein